jgi:protein TonB
MAKPLRSELTNPPSVQFRDFGVLNDGTRSKGATVTSIVLNVTLAALVVILGIVVKTNPAMAKKLTEITLPPEPPPAPKPLPKPPPPPPPKPLPVTPPVPPKIKLPPPPDAPPDPKPLPTPPVVKPTPVILPPSPPKKVDPPPAPTKVSLAVATAASIPNHDAHPSAVKLGSTTNPLKSLTGAATSPVNLGNAGMPGMRASNTGNGPNSTKVNLGSGSPNGNNLNGHDNTAGRPVVGVSFGVKGGTGPLNQPQHATAVQMGAPPPPPAAQHTVMTTASATPPKILYKPTPVYTEEAKNLHLEGKATVSVIFHANGTMEVIGLVHGLGHGLDDSALQAAKGVRFQPALDVTGRPVDFPTQIIITFALVS